MNGIFTPGEWKNAGMVGYGILIATAEQPIAVVYGPTSNSHAEGNAQLICASSDMLAALRDLLFVVEVNPNWGSEQLSAFNAATKKAKAAISKAEGQ